ncbi:hypothetical protein LMG31886_00460 [Xanthomonas hydrangeae]|uniref:Uncharacterized protein n=1 Tax=Xanthomonas hortorum TaxID=56454 RepID=A0AA47EUB8_9XANT|nr:hypothetical protein [Xanthomonas hortorum]CAD7719716.1 hypothetical protein LMG31886_00460 [Xanthomonas hydrangeae]WAH64483.1 hypothetical protein OEG85_00285 [Xanthomonas hortorum]CAD7719720.1 hypothetical protein LMG31886_00460 [Xanthomonas hydrangeae]CAD7730576.1 hypothetical protein LMG31885_15020 [Xanthomonas hydrangeae]CAD7730580.1 hypothetical protein LMG31885_15020 [Xanthomonas hydrangeae]
MSKIKVKIRSGISLKEALDCHSMLRGLAANIDGFQTVKGRTNFRLLIRKYSVFHFRNEARASRFLRRGRERLGDVFRFRRVIARQ